MLSGRAPTRPTGHSGRLARTCSSIGSIALVVVAFTAACMQVDAFSFMRALSIWKSTDRFVPEDLHNLRRTLTARGPGQGLYLAIGEVNRLVPDRDKSSSRCTVGAGAGPSLSISGACDRPHGCGGRHRRDSTDRPWWFSDVAPSICSIRSAHAS
jgi:hypothetical protein